MTIFRRNSFYGVSRNSSKRMLLTKVVSTPLSRFWNFFIRSNKLTRNTLQLRQQSQLRLVAFLHFRRTKSQKTVCPVKGETQDNNFGVEEDVVRAVMDRLQEAPVSLVPGHNQVPDPNPATVTLGKENPCFASTARKLTTSKKDVLQESKTMRPVFEMMVLHIFQNNRGATNSSPTDQVTKVRAKCIRFFRCRFNDPSH